MISIKIIVEIGNCQIYSPQFFEEVTSPFGEQLALICVKLENFWWMLVFMDSSIPFPISSSNKFWRVYSVRMFLSYLQNDAITIGVGISLASMPSTHSATPIYHFTTLSVPVICHSHWVGENYTTPLTPRKLCRGVHGLPFWLGVTLFPYMGGI